ncbi:ABC-F family ATP-binding cassette domain-containing protein [Nocardiopsis sp. MG754419]|uniref:ABC-F family ATP-binding cassette domain-containing protein n=1 Tax=Nocardiopsis sp. MG754419 TaxID=2259865 RepID=UPI001BA7C2A1|nr:ATP-binding cassette domain-containing protein [Nocardiopsis sp. MG754419]MBR8741020.1 ABC transporter ATP-binding protein [Nocardiopsis sp. MG754419]
MTFAVVCDRLTFSWPDGTTPIRDLDVTFGTGRTGLIGRNGTGKSTLLRLVAGHLTPTSGTIAVDGDVGHLAQSTPLAADATVAELLGIERTRLALHAVEAGGTDPADFAAIGDDWDIEERALAHLERFGLDLGVRSHAPLDRRVAALSGGESILTALAGIALRRPAVTLLDEPTNNLDRPARERLYRAVEHWPGVLVVVGHDPELLGLVDRIAELRDGHLRTWGGDFTAYTEQVAAEQEAARRAVRAAEGGVRRERRQLAEAQVKLARRVRFGQKKYDTKREPRVIMNQRKREAQVSAGKHRATLEERLSRAREERDRAEETVRDDPAIRIHLPHTEVPAGQDVLLLERWSSGAETDLIARGASPRGPGKESAQGPGPAADGRWSLRGPERVAIVGPNGSGKTTLVRAIVAAARGSRTVPPGYGPPVRVAHVTDRVGYLPQRLDLPDGEPSVLDHLRAAAPSASEQVVRAGLARFLLRGDRVERRVADLSGGERFRVALARLLLADAPPRLLILDEPTNNLDLESRAQLVQALGAYRGALLVVGHDHVFLEEIGVRRRWAVERGRPPVEVVGSGGGPS